MRLFRAAIAVWVFSEVWRTGEWLLVLPGLLFAAQAIFNVGCCGTSGCAPARPYNGSNNTEEVVYEEVNKPR